MKLPTPKQLRLVALLTMGCALLAIMLDGVTPNLDLSWVVVALCGVGISTGVAYVFISFRERMEKDHETNVVEEQTGGTRAEVSTEPVFEHGKKRQRRS